MSTVLSNGTKDKGRISLALIATYPQMAETLGQIAAEAGVVFYNIDASFEDAVDEAEKIKPRVDAIMSRGGTGDYIRKAVDIPVVSIPITPFDLLETIYKHEIRNQEAAFVSFNRPLYGVREIEKMFNIIIREYVFIDRKDIINAINDIRSRGITTVIGGELTASLANAEGMRGIEINSGKEAIYHTFDETIKLVKVRREEKNVSARLQVAFDTLAEGIIITNEKKIVTKFNTASERILNNKRKKVEGLEFTEEVLKEDYENAFNNRKPTKDSIKHIGDTTAMINHLPVHLEGKFIGVVSTIEDVTKIQKLESRIRKELFKKGFFAKYTLDDIITVNRKMLKVKELTKIYAMTMSNILIEGESGTGKEILAQSIHMASPCAKGPFIAVNCAALPKELLESELFGYEAGAFTGAKRDGKVGLFELAHGGTIFLDEIGEIPISLQASLLRVIQEREIMRIGGDKLIPINVRVLSATNVDLKEKIEQELFRKDLYYRISVFNIKVPPLRERKEDVPVLTREFIKNNGLVNEKKVELVEQIVHSMEEHDWPGNIRELNNIVERICLLIMNLGDSIHTKEELEEYLDIPQSSKPRNPNELQVNVNLEQGLKEAISEVERKIIHRVLHDCDNDQKAVMDKLRIGRSTLWRKHFQK